MHERQPRVPFSRPVHVTAGGEWPRARRLLAGNVSEGGMFVRTDAELPPGARVELSLEAKGKLFPFAQAEVVWRADTETASKNGRLPGFGLRFVRFLHPRSEKLIDHLVSRGASALPPEVGEQVVGEPPSAPLPPPDFASRPIRELAAEPSFAESALPEIDMDPSEPLAGDQELTSSFDAPDHGARVATAVGLIAVLVIVGGGMLWMIRRNAQQLAELSGPAAQGVAEAAPIQPAPPAPGLEPAQVKAEAAAPEPAPSSVAAVLPTAEDTEAPTPAPRHAEPAVEPRPAAAAPAVAKPAAAPKAASASVPLTSGAATKVRFARTSEGLTVHVELAPGARLDRAFHLSSPARLVVDLNGPSPRGSQKLQPQDALVAGVRTGARAGGTRLVLDLERAVSSVNAEPGAGNSLEVHVRLAD